MFGLLLESMQILRLVTFYCLRRMLFFPNRDEYGSSGSCTTNGYLFEFELWLDCFRITDFEVLFFPPGYVLMFFCFFFLHWVIVTHMGSTIVSTRFQQCGIFATHFSNSLRVWSFLFIVVFCHLQWESCRHCDIWRIARLALASLFSKRI